jgi:hypothetical protein
MTMTVVPSGDWSESRSPSGDIRWMHGGTKAREAVDQRMVMIPAPRHSSVPGVRSGTASNLPRLSELQSSVGRIRRTRCYPKPTSIKPTATVRRAASRRSSAQKRAERDLIG